MMVTISISVSTLEQIAFCSLIGGMGYNQASMLSLLIDGELSPFIN